MSTLTWARKQNSLFRDKFGMLRIGWVVGFVLAAAVVFIAALIAALFVALTLAMRSYGRGACATWGKQAGFDTKFVLVGWADSGTCLAKAPNGQWVLNTSVQQFIQAGKR